MLGKFSIFLSHKSNSCVETVGEGNGHKTLNDMINAKLERLNLHGEQNQNRNVIVISVTLRPTSHMMVGIWVSVHSHLHMVIVLLHWLVILLSILLLYLQLSRLLVLWLFVAKGLCDGWNSKNMG